MDDRITGITQARRARRDGVQHRLNVGGRAGNNTENIARSGLLFQGFLELVEQSDILDRYYGLIRKGFKELDLRRRKGTSHSTSCEQSTDELSLLPQWNTQEGAPAPRRQFRKIILCIYIGNVKRSVLADPAKSRFVTTDSLTARGYGDRPNMSANHNLVTLFEAQHHVIHSTNPRRAL